LIQSKKSRDLTEIGGSASVNRLRAQTSDSMVSCVRFLIKGFLVVLTAASICFVLAAALSSQKESYAIVVDAGSTGSRAFIFRFSLDNDGRRSITSIKGMKVMPGLSSFSKSSADDVVGYLLPTFIDAAVIIPKSCHKSTKVYIKGTAGFRLLPEEDQLYIWNCLHDGLQSNKNVPFVIEKENLGTIDGKFEAYYAVLASNYVAGSVDGDLLRVDGKAMVGALDMGGSSTQLIFHTGTVAGHPIQIADFWSHSWLNFGVERVRERVWQSLIEEHEKSLISDDIKDRLDLETKTPSVVIENPCTFIGHEEGSSLSEEYSFIGTGSAKKCVELIKKVIWPEGVCSNPPCAVDGIVHPPIGGEFYGMSVYYYGLDCIRYLGPKTLSWCVKSYDMDRHRDFKPSTFSIK
jgi:Golgi nucleoside diphosphatase